MIKAGAARLRALGPWRATLALTLAVAVLHLLAAGRVPLSADEAHYALYGLHRDWSYFDHPPLVGWLQALVLFFASSDFALRLWPIGLSAATALVLFRFARRLFPGDSEWLAFWTVVLYQSGLLFQALGLALVPETPLLLFALLAMLALLNALERGQLAAWLLFGLCIGLAGLSKYTAVTLVFTAALFVILQRRLDVLRTPGPWLAVALALVLIAPVLYWNATHDWLSFRYQLEHGYRAKDWEWTRVGITQLAQFFAYAPGIYVFGLIALVDRIQGMARARRAVVAAAGTAGAAVVHLRLGARRKPAALDGARLGRQRAAGGALAARALGAPAGACLQLISPAAIRWR